jgi:signal transduction histidine kinase
VSDHTPLKVGQEWFLNLQLSIIDTGNGISKEGCEMLFMDFGKLDENANQNRQGTGLGLSICKRIAEQMSGSVSVQSELGLGTCFNVNIST